MTAARDKIRPLEDLAALLEGLRAQGRTVVHCHGVFDLVHVGHIRYFEQARAMGDVLVVTVTPDRHVNKGPHRPAFTDQLRAEVIAALDCVDYVAINRWPTAVETIRLLRPGLYVKGPDYRDPATDVTGGIVKEEEAVRSVGGRLAFTDDILFSSSALLNRHLPAFPQPVVDYLHAFGTRHPEAEVLKYLDGARGLNVLVVGEAIIDEYVYCHAIGKSSKEPMLAVKRLSAETFAGGSLAVANHVAGFCDRVSLLTLLGAENSREAFVRESLRPGIALHPLFRRQSPTIVKRRFVESYFFTKLIEEYEINDGPLEAADNDALCAALRDLVPRHDAVIVVDFGHGMIGPEAIAILRDGARFLAVNAQSNAGNLGYHAISRYPRVDYICIAEKEMRLEARDRRGDLQPIVEDVARRLAARRVTVTRGNRGCLCYAPEEGFVEVPALAGRVVDRMGAGDAVLAVTSLCVAQGAPPEVVGFIGNAVGAQAVATVGNRTPVDRAGLAKQIVALLK